MNPIIYSLIILRWSFENRPSTNSYVEKLVDSDFRGENPKTISISFTFHALIEIVST